MTCVLVNAKHSSACAAWCGCGGSDLHADAVDGYATVVHPTTAAGVAERMASSRYKQSVHHLGNGNSACRAQGSTFGIPGVLEHTHFLRDVHQV